MTNQLELFPMTAQSLKEIKDSMMHLSCKQTIIYHSTLKKLGIRPGEPIENDIHRYLYTPHWCTPEETQRLFETLIKINSITQN